LAAHRAAFGASREAAIDVWLARASAATGNSASSC